MKRTIYLLSMCLMMVLTTMCTSCTRDYSKVRTPKSELRKDSLWFTQMLEMCQPSKPDYVFEDIVDVIATQEELQDEYGQIETFLSMDPQTISNVCTVLFKHQHKLKLKDIVDEYYSHRKIYDGLLDSVYEEQSTFRERKESSDTLVINDLNQ